MGSHRLQRVNELIKRELGEVILREFTFDAKLVTVQSVDVTPDLKHAHVFISVIGTDAEARAALAQLHDKRTLVKHEMARRVILKYTPQIHFKLDESVERGTRILTILQQLDLPEDPAPPEEDNQGYTEER